MSLSVRPLLASLAGLSALLSTAAAEDLLLTNGHIVDPEAREVRTGALLIRDGVIADELAAAPDDFTGPILDLDGKWIIPGLTDMHVHSYGNLPDDFPGTPGIAVRNLAVGVTGFVDLFNDEDSLVQLRAAQQAGELGGADIYASLSCLTAPSGHCTEYGVKTRTMASPEEAHTVVADLATRKPDVIKIVYQPSGAMPSIDKATFAAAVEEATAHGLKTIVHIGNWDEIRDAIDVGATAVTHIPDQPIPEGMAEEMAESGIVWIPTMTVEMDYVNFVFDPSVLDAPMAQAVAPPSAIEAYRAGDMITYAVENEAALKDHNVILGASVKTAADAGVIVLAGTDAGNRGVLQGYSMHRELILMVEAGLSPWQALAAATTDAGDFLGHSFGISPGDKANLVILNASPFEDIANTQDISMVVHHGKIVDPEKLLASDITGLKKIDN